jgi:predicted outer membrane repeat protein
MYNSSSSTSVTNCTISGNQAGYDGGGIYSYQSCPVLNSSILWGNTDSGGSDESAQILPYLYFGTANVNYNCIQGWTGSLGGTGNFSMNPRFVDSANGDYHLRWSSFCINGGDPSVVSNPDKKDFDSELRFMAGRVDMGADETNHYGPGDLNENGLIDAADLPIFVQSWLSGPGQGGWNGECDFNEDGRINFADYGDIASFWMQ